ncbi:VanZ family protein [Alteribacter keqinensis]|uniref:VanZ family protein n=1 Tax=Alteribacter keqinensis TaxID=2483800 RepID=A0A3M7TZ89_9BACI|nr:VanZ family protein [Alteribacter keqinensis]RNA70611.1 VanZ family protein [Alteribacter keqinensis]
MKKNDTQQKPEDSIKRKRKPRAAVTLLFLLYMASLFYVVFFAWNYGSSYGPVGADGRNLNVVPLLSIHNIYYYSTDIWVPVRILLGNIVMFIPFGYLFPLLYRRWRRSLLGILPVGFLALVLSVFIEVNQYFFTYRVANVDDVILNTIGGLIGASLYWLAVKLHVLYVKTAR